jgi:hypothetical protein
MGSGGLQLLHARGSRVQERAVWTQHLYVPTRAGIATSIHPLSAAAQGCVRVSNYIWASGHSPTGNHRPPESRRDVHPGRVSDAVSRAANWVISTRQKPEWAAHFRRATTLPVLQSDARKPLGGFLL